MRFIVMYYFDTFNIHRTNIYIMVNTRERIQAVVNSAMRLNPNTESSTDFTYRFNKTFARVTEVVIQSIQLPFTFYAINSNNNQLTVTRGTDKTITIPPGNYNATNMIAILNVALNNAADPVDGTPYGGFTGETFSVTYSSVSLKFTFTNNNPFIIRAKSSTYPNSTLAKALGITSDITGVLPIAPYLGPYKAVAVSAANLVGPQYLRIESKYLSAPTQHKPLYANNTFRESLFIVPVNAGFGSFVTTDLQIPIRYTYKVTIQNTDTIDFKLVDEDDNVIDLNGNDWSMYIVLVTE